MRVQNGHDGFPGMLDMLANDGEGSKRGPCSKPPHSCKPRAWSLSWRGPSLVTPTWSGCAGGSTV